MKDGGRESYNGVLMTMTRDPKRTLRWTKNLHFAFLTIQHFLRSFITPLCITLLYLQIANAGTLCDKNKGPWQKEKKKIEIRMNLEGI